VLHAETWSLSGGVRDWLKRSTREGRKPVIRNYDDDDDDDNNNNNNNNNFKGAVTSRKRNGSRIWLQHLATTAFIFIVQWWHKRICSRLQANTLRIHSSF
jgi:hypothetical protein